MMIRKLIDWATLKDYEDAKAEASARVVRRYARGNTVAQNHDCMDEVSLASLSRRGDAAIAHIREHARAS